MIPGVQFFEKPISVPEILDSKHELVVATRKALAAATSDKYGILRPPVPGILDIAVGSASVDRGLRIIDTLITAFEGAGYAIEVDASLGTTFAVIYEERIPFSITEMVRRDERAPTDGERAEMRRNPWKKGPHYSYSPTGELTLQIGGSWQDGRHRRKWSDGKPRRLEDCLYSFVRSLLISAETRRRRRQETAG